MTIRKAIKKDAGNLAAIGVCVWVDTYATEGLRDNLSEYILSEFCKHNMEAMIETHTVFVAEENNHILGYMVLHVDESRQCEVESLYILPEFQKNGIGKLFIDKAVALFNGNVCLSCWENNSNAIGFYRAIGFVEAGEKFFQLDREQHRNILFKYSA